MRDREFAPESLGHAIDEQRDGDRRRIRRYDGAAFPHAIDLLVDLALDIQSFNDRLGDPVGIREPLQVVFDIANRNAIDETPVQESGLTGILQAFERSFADCIASLILRRNVEQ